MKKKEYRIRTDRFTAVLVTFVPEENDEPVHHCCAHADDNPPYLLIGPADGQPARIDGIDVELLMMLLSHVRNNSLPPMLTHYLASRR